MESDSPLGDATIAADLLDDDEAEPVLVDDGTLPHDRFLDRELSWLAFNQRVLELGEDPNQPLLERANYLAFFASNLDEFFMVRVAGLKRRIATGLAVPTNVGRAPLGVLADVSEKAHELQLRHAQAYYHLVRPALSEVGITVATWDELDEADRAQMREVFSQQIF